MSYNYHTNFQDKGFTLIELLIYVAIFSILAVVFSSIIVVYLKVNQEQTARNEISSQINFVLNNFQRMIGEAGTAVVRDDISSGNNWDEEDSAIGTPQPYLILKTGTEGNQLSDSNSPIVIYADSGEIKIIKGRGADKTNTTLTTKRVSVSDLNFKKVINYPGREIIEISLTMNYASGNPTEQISRQLISGVGKAEAAIFDTSLLPGASGSADIGQNTKRWRDGYFSGNLSVNNQMDTNTLTVGNETIINGLRTGFLTINPPAIAGNSNGTLTISAGDIGASDRIFLTPPSNLESGLVFVGARAIDNSNEIEITLRNTTGANINGAPKDWAYLLVK